MDSLQDIVNLQDLVAKLLNRVALLEEDNANLRTAFVSTLRKHKMNVFQNICLVFNNQFRGFEAA